MTLLLQQLLVGIAVAGCVLYSGWRLLTPRARLRALGALSRMPGAARSAWLGRLRARTLSGAGGGCAGCGASATPGAPGPNRTPGAPRR